VEGPPPLPIYRVVAALALQPFTRQQALYPKDQTSIALVSSATGTVHGHVPLSAVRTTNTKSWPSIAPQLEMKRCRIKSACGPVQERPSKMIIGGILNSFVSI
jgi:hypothetical protein